MNVETRPWDTSEHLDTPEAIAAYLEAVLEERDPSLFTHALGQVARARGMSQIAADAGLSREALYRALSRDGDPRLSTLSAVMKALGVRLTVEPAG
ncbi:MAG: putative addiction module antidote protein [Phreatobacter sp.]|uniref:addiction module antidote protein n=1 Tax=Phreatobacter sp. TaxID=1966341 RepID=UPI0027360029|nr:addiction module antidote protein [Phreatobacter sp.]MDP2803728.1 putative addiction module antidote protein [Phreatobacter sp.]